MPLLMGSRRRFLKVLATTSVGAVVFAGCKAPAGELVAQSRARLAEEVVSAEDGWYATACRGCGAGCGTIVRVVEGRARKVEGNPAHPVNLGKLCARGQAGVQEQYHPDRYRGPLLRTGERGGGQLIPITWEEAVERLAGRLGELQGRAGAVALLTRPLGGHQALVVERFAAATGARWLRIDPLNELPLREAVRRVFGQERLPYFDIGNARYVLSFGADFLSTWLSPVHYGVQYGIFRQGEYSVERFGPAFEAGRPRGRLVQVEPRLSVTAANADEWVPIRPGREGLLALSLAQVLLAEGLADPSASAAPTAGALDGYAPELVAGETGVAAERIRRLARELAAERPALVLGGGPAGAQTNGTENLTAVLALNRLLGNVGQPGGVLFNAPPPIDGLPATTPASTLSEWQALADDLRAGRVQAILDLGADPLYGLPATLGMREALERAPFIASFASLPDDTSALADLIVPSHPPLEAWGDSVVDPAPGVPVWTVQQPVVRPLYDTRSSWDVLLALGQRLGGPLQQVLPWATFEDVLRDGARQLHRRVGGSGDGADFERFWVGLLQRGGWWDGGSGEPAARSTFNVQRSTFEGVLAGSSFQAAAFAGTEQDYPFHLLPFSHNTLGDGRGAHLPWLQAAPDPITSVAWQSWVEVNPRVAEGLGLREGDVAALESVYGRLELPVYVNPAASPEVLGIPMGQGHGANGRWAEGRGSNPLVIVAPLVDQATGALAYGATRVRLAPAGRRVALPKLEGTVPAYQLEGAEVLKVAEGLRAGGWGLGKDDDPQSPAPSRQPPAPDPYSWGMVVDLDRCIGCQACVVACQAENNVPINDEQRFVDHRAIEWIRIERYWEGEFPEVKARFLPVLCQHCGNAPCEAVCPVYATQHSTDGLNVQVYNRCVGTRYCGNNCPYNVRFFNWSDPIWPRPLHSQLNPDVTVRGRGVIEKCTFCIQRINRAKRGAARAGRAVADGELQPACAQACPTSALVFGNRREPGSRINRLAADPRAYRLLAHLGTDPAVTYLKVVKA